MAHRKGIPVSPEPTDLRWDLAGRDSGLDLNDRSIDLCSTGGVQRDGSVVAPMSWCCPVAVHCSLEFIALVGHIVVLPANGSEAKTSDLKSPERPRYPVSTSAR